VRRAVGLAVLATLGGLGCGGDEPVGRLGSAAPQPAEATEAPDRTERTFGTAPDRTRPLTPLADILAEPERYRDQVVRTEGQIAQVCQRMGCWMELREGDDGPRVRVPMAGHSFFLPRDVAGRRAMLEGRVAIQHLTADVRAHLEGEGATATASALSITASGVVVQ
jgi:hypothetical protein